MKKILIILMFLLAPQTTFAYTKDCTTGLNKYTPKCLLQKESGTKIKIKKSIQEKTTNLNEKKKAYDKKNKTLKQMMENSKLKK